MIHLRSFHTSLLNEVYSVVLFPATRQCKVWDHVLPKIRGIGRILRYCCDKCKPTVLKDLLSYSLKSEQHFVMVLGCRVVGIYIIVVTDYLAIALALPHNLFVGQ